MFNPAAVQKSKGEAQAKKKAIKHVKEMCLQIIPKELQEGLVLDVNEQVCGDPSCSPVDTIIMIFYENGGRGMFGVPAEATEVQFEDLEELFPDVETLTAWKSGQEAEWPRRPELRFGLDTRVQCRVGPHPVKGWAAGTVVALHYAEPSWPPGAMAPYQIKLDDGRLIYAPQDADNVIRLLQDDSNAIPIESKQENEDNDEKWEDEDEEEDA
eukprot:gene482-902_t